MIVNKHGFKKRYAYGGSGIFDTHPSESFLNLEGRLIKADNNSYGNNDLISLRNNGVMHVFKRIRYDLSGQEIEAIVHPGQATPMLGLLNIQMIFLNLRD